jgi:hypothetical protein
VFVQEGPSVIGGQNNVCLLQDAAAMQKGFDDDRGSRRRLRDKISTDLETDPFQQTTRCYQHTQQCSPDFSRWQLDFLGAFIRQQVYQLCCLG